MRRVYTLVSLINIAETLENDWYFLALNNDVNSNS